MVWCLKWFKYRTSLLWYDHNSFLRSFRNIFHDFIWVVAFDFWWRWDVLRTFCFFVWLSNIILQLSLYSRQQPYNKYNSCQMILTQRWQWVNPFSGLLTTSKHISLLLSLRFLVYRYNRTQILKKNKLFVISLQYLLYYKHILLHSWSI